LVFAHVASELNSWVAGTGFLNRLNVPMSIGMIATRNHQFRVRYAILQDLEGRDHQFQALVGSPFAKGKDALLGITTARKVGELGTSSQSSVRPYVHIVAAVFVEQNFAIPGHEHGYGIRKQQHSCGERAGHPVGARKAYSSVFQVDGIHEMVQCHMGVAAAQAGQQWSHQSGKRNQGIAAESAEQEVEPDDVGLQFPERAQ
jgi:hypothetical protein